MKIHIKNDDIINIKNSCIEVTAKNKKYTFDKSEIEEISIITNNLGPFNDDMGLTIKINKSAGFFKKFTIFIMSENPLFEKILFDELKEIADIDYDAVTQAMSCVENKEFVLYKQ